MKFIDFFAGVGGFRRGMELAGHECVGFCEFDKFATASYISMHLLTDDQRKALEDIPIKQRQKEILKEEYRNGEWYANDIRRVYAGDIPKADCWCFGFPCFAKGTYILTEKGYIPIEDISVGDKVLTHKGRWRKVTATMHRDGARLWDVNGFGILPTRTTAGHPYYVAKPDQPMEFKKVEQLDDSWYSTMVLPDAESDGYSKEMWWIIGRYLADGWRVERKDRPSGGRIVFAISDDKRTEFEQRLREAKLHGTYTKEQTCGKYHVCNNQLYEYLEKFGKYAHGKRIPREALCLPREKAKYFFDGYMSGDGRSDREEATSTSAAIILGMCIIAQRLGKSVPAVYYTRRDEKCVIQGRECRQRDTYTFRISSKSVKGHYRARYVCRELYQPTESDDFGTVYNISVEEDNSYVANGAIVHNCQDISVAGKQAGFQGNRSSLFFRVMYLIGQLKEEDKPAYLFIENVKNLLSVNGGWDFARLLIEMEQGGYDAEWQVLNSKDFGVPQNRERCFIIGHLRGRSSAEVFPVEGADGKNSVSLNLFGCLNGRNSQRDRVYSDDGLAPTISTKPGGNTEPKVSILFDTSYIGQDGKARIYENICPTLTSRDYKEPRSVGVVCNVNPSGKGMNGNVYDSNGLNPTLTTNKGEGNKIAIPVLTPDRVEKRQNGRRFKEDGEPMFTLTSQDRHGVAIDPLGVLRNVRTEYGKEIRKDYESGKLDISRHEFLANEIREDGIANTLSTVQKDNQLAVKVAEATKQGYSECRVGIDTVNLSVPGSKTRRGRVGKEVANTLDTSCNQGIFVQISEELTVYAVWYEKYQCYIAIRKLTPRECFRLQGWSDDYFEKAQFVNSDSQLYKQAGNGVTVTVIEAMARKMNVNLN
jgi:DNA (cytosine-5)-methyltransferase 1